MSFSPRKARNPHYLGHVGISALLDLAELVLRLPAPVPRAFKGGDLRVGLVTPGVLKSR
jgi:hypothetical protein